MRWVLMTNHLHVIVGEGYNISDIIRDFKEVYKQEDNFNDKR